MIQVKASHRILIVITVMLVAILEVLDSTIVNVALPHMMPALGADQDQITWVLTSYVVSSAIMLPLTGFLSARFGEKNLIMVNVAGFLVSSFLCGTANSLEGMVFYRACQGCFGAALIPLSQSILKQVFPPEQLGKAMGVWVLGVLVAPIFGPTLGGLITQSFSWRWVFYINTPICAAAVFLVYLYIPKIEGHPKRIEWWGIFWMVLGIGSLQILLDQGNSHDWFSSNEISILALLAIIGLISFVYQSLRATGPAVNLRLFRHRTFTLATLSLMLFCALQFSLLTLEPMMLQSLFHYTALISGMTMISMGLCSCCTVAMASSLIGKLDVKIILIAGCVLCMIGAGCLATMTLDASQSQFLWANGFLGAGMGCMMLPLSVVSLSDLSEKDGTEGAGLFSAGRMLGTSMGISLMSTLVSRQTQINWHSMGAGLTSFNVRLQHWMWLQHGSIHHATTMHTLQQIVHQQASMRAFLNAFYLASVGFALIIPMVLFMKPKKLTLGVGH